MTARWGFFRPEGPPRHPQRHSPRFLFQQGIEIL